MNPTAQHQEIVIQDASSDDGLADDVHPAHRHIYDGPARASNQSCPFSTEGDVA